MVCVTAWYAVHVKMWFDIMKSTYTFLTLFYINSLSDFFFTSFFFCCFLFIFVHPTKTLCRKRLCLILACVSSYRWVHFSRAVLFCQPHQQLVTHSLVVCCLFVSSLFFDEGREHLVHTIFSLLKPGVGAALSFVIPFGALPCLYTSVKKLCVRFRLSRHHQKGIY